MGSFDHLKCLAQYAQLARRVIVLINGIRVLVVEAKNAVVAFIAKLEHFYVDIAAFRVVLEQDFDCAAR